ncbi:11810_t:CDS:2, partial [Dentiscutata heterogama]
VESLSCKNCLPPPVTTDKTLLPVIYEENEDNSSILLKYEVGPKRTILDHNINNLLNNGTEPEQTKLEQNINCSDNIHYNDDLEGTTFNGLNTANGEADVENKIIFYMFLVKQETPLGE